MKNILDKANLKQQLKSYSALAAALLAGSPTANADVIYTDIDPDALLQGEGGDFLIDMNGDGVEEFSIYMYNSSSETSDGAIINQNILSIYGQEGDRIVADKDKISITYTTSSGQTTQLSFGFNKVTPLDEGVEINNDLNWQTQASSTGSYSSSYNILGAFVDFLDVKLDHFVNVENKFIGVEFNLDGEKHFGWIRLDVSYKDNKLSTTIKDFAYESEPGMRIITGEMGDPPQAEAVSNIILEDIGDNKNGSDLQVSFENVDNENLLDQYRVIVVKDDVSTAFELETANALSSDRYTPIPTTGTDPTFPLLEESRDSDGDLITNDIAYRVFILSVADGTVAKDNVLSDPSDVITLTSPVGINQEFLNGQYDFYVFEKQLNLQMHQSLNQAMQISIYNISGQKIQQLEILSGSLKLELNHLPSGTYFAELRNANNRSVHHFSL